jgi:hypothetical protein
MVQLNDHFTYKKLFKAVIPSIAMMVFISIYSIVDGLFVSNFVGTTAFAGLNLIYPVLMIVGAIGFMLGTGGSALVAKTLGENANVVRIMSIHKSKGLEFPVVICSGMGKNFNTQDFKKNILYHHKLGYGPQLVD